MPAATKIRQIIAFPAILCLLWPGYNQMQPVHYLADQYWPKGIYLKVFEQVLSCNSRKAGLCTNHTTVTGAQGASTLTPPTGRTTSLVTWRELSRYMKYACAVQEQVDMTIGVFD